MTAAQLRCQGQVTYPRFFAFIVGFGLFICGLPIGCGIRCLQCATLQEGCISGRQPAKECADYDAKYCLIYIGYIMGGVMASRDCMTAELEHKSICMDKVLEGQKVRICYETCNTNGCNGGPITSASFNYQRLTSGAYDMRTKTLRFVGLATLWSLTKILTGRPLVVDARFDK